MKLATAVRWARSLVLTALVLGALLAAPRANALSSIPVTDTEVKALVKRLITEAGSSGTGGASDAADLKTTLELMVRVRPIVEMTTAACPMPIKITNGTAVAAYNVKVQTTEHRGKTGAPTKTIFHIPYIPAKSSVSGSVTCSLKKNIYGIGERDIYLSVSPIGEISHLDDDGIRELAHTKQDAVTSAYGFSAGGDSASEEDPPPLTGDETIDEILARRANRANGGLGGATGSANKSKDAGAGADAGSKTTAAASASDETATDNGKPSMISLILLEDLTDPDFKQFATAVLKSTDGAKAVGTFIRKYPGNPVLTQLSPFLATAPAAKVALLLQEAMRGYDPRSSSVLVAAATRVCAPGQPEEARANTWLAALAPDVGNTTVRDAVLAKCGVGKDQLRARLKAAKGEQLGRALDGMQGDLFDVAVAAMVDSKSLLAAEELLANTQNPTKFDAVAKAASSFVTTVPKRQELVRSVAAGKVGALDETKARWLDAVLGGLHAEGGDQAALLEIISDMAAGKVANAEVRKVVIAHRKDAGPGAFEPFRASLGEKALILSPAWVFAQVDAGAIDIVDLVGNLRAAAKETVGKTSGYSTYGSAGTTGCQASAANAERCLDAVKDLKLTKESFDPTFLDSAVGFVQGNAHDPTAVALLVKLKGYGVDVTRAVDALCKAAPSSPGRYGYGEDDPLRKAISLDASNACISHVQAARGSAERWLLAGIGVRLALVFVPFGFVALLARKRFVPVRAQLAKENAELDAVRGRAALMARLEGHGGDDSITSGLADAARWLAEQSEEELAGAGRALAALTPEVRAGIVARERSLSSRAGETGAVATCLCELEGMVLYLACFPGREDQPQTVRRQAGFADGWPTHMSALLEACAADGKPKRVLSLVTMLRTDGTRMTMLVGYDSDSLHLVPEALAADASPGDVAPRTHDHRYEISQISHSPQTA